MLKRELNIPWEAISSHLASILIRVVGSALGPGTVIVCEAAALLVPRKSAQTFPEAATYLLEPLQKLNIYSGALVVTALAFASFTLGLASLRVVRRVADRRLKAARVPISDIYGGLINAYGQEPVGRVLREHPIAQSLARAQVPPSGHEDGEVLPGDFDSHRGHIFAYCKTWLRRNDATLSVDVDSLEAQIKLLYGMALPCAIFPLVALRWMWNLDFQPFPVAALTAASLASLLLVRSLVLAGHSMQQREHHVAIRNFFFAHWQSR